MNGGGISGPGTPIGPRKPGNGIRPGTGGPGNNDKNQW